MMMKKKKNMKASTLFSIEQNDREIPMRCGEWSFLVLTFPKIETRAAVQDQQ